MTSSAATLKDLLETPHDLRFCRGSTPEKVALFNRVSVEHSEAQGRNPFSGQVVKPTLNKNDPNYGRPIEGSKTDIRGKKAASHVSKEILELCEVIHESGKPLRDDPEHVVISFGELFNLYTIISNKVVGILLRARKYEFVHFDGEVLFQRRDDDVPIFLMKPIKEIREIFRSGNPLAHGTQQNSQASQSCATVGGQ